MNIQSHDLSVDGLRDLMVAALSNAGWSPEEIAGYVAAQEKAGWLRPQCPAWIRNSAGVYYALPPSGAFADPRPLKVTPEQAQIGGSTPKPPGAPHLQKRNPA